jgi:hypothetical protein
MRCIGPRWLHNFWVRLLVVLNKLTGLDNYTLAIGAYAVGTCLMYTTAFVSGKASFLWIAAMFTVSFCTFSTKMRYYSQYSTEHPGVSPASLSDLQFAYIFAMLASLWSMYNLIYSIIEPQYLPYSLAFFLLVGATHFSVHHIPRGTGLIGVLKEKWASRTIKSNLLPAPA